MKPIVLTAFLLLFAILPAQAMEKPPQEDTAKLIIAGADGPAHSFNVELALEAAAQARGLMFRTDLPEDGGMLFFFGQETPRSFWMRNTYIPLDMLFIKADGTIGHIHHRAIPEDLTPIPSNGPAVAVLEILGGTAEKLGIKAGDKVYNKRFFGNELKK